jgi:hypothetical protein
LRIPKPPAADSGAEQRLRDAMYCGHCGRPSTDSWWLNRSGLPRAEKEFEAEGAAHLVLARAGLRSSSAEYLSGYANGCDMTRISVDAIIRAANRIEDHYKA